MTKKIIVTTLSCVFFLQSCQTVQVAPQGTRADQENPPVTQRGNNAPDNKESRASASEDNGDNEVVENKDEGDEGDEGVEVAETEEQAAAEEAAAVAEVREQAVSDQVPIITQGEELEVIPIEINDKVRMWLRYFQGRGRPHMERYLARSTRYEALMKKVLRDNRLPEDLFYIALIESGFSSRAHSHASAVGYWQFIRGTGKRYKMEISRMVDERRDPLVATQAAANYFKDLYRMFNSWYLSMAAYNVGEGRVARVIKKYNTRDFWELSKNRRALPSETDNYVPKYIAAKLIAKNPDKYGFDGIDYMPPIEFDLFTFNQPLNLRVMAEKMNINYEDFKDLNPKYKGEVAPLSRAGTLELRIPPNTQKLAMQASAESVVANVAFIPDQQEMQVYVVRRGDTFSGLARKFRTNIAYLREINDFPRKKQLRTGQRIFVPDRTPLREKVATRSKVTPGAGSAVAGYHTVRSGDTLSSIANRYGTSINELRELNGLGRNSMIKAGTRLRISSKSAANVAAGGQVVNTSNAGTAATRTHVVLPGETLSAIAVKYRVSVSELLRVNNLNRRSTLRVGVTLVLPESAVIDQGSHRKIAPNKNVSNRNTVQRTHVVRAGENLSMISSRYGVSLSEMLKANNMNLKSNLHVGTRLKVPGGASNSRAVAASAARSSTRAASAVTNSSRGAARKQAATGRKTHHVVKRGEHLSLIANKYNVTLSELLRVNNMDLKSTLPIGSRVKLPSDVRE